jgi:putative ABC transport system ATP-binding protein
MWNSSRSAESTAPSSHAAGEPVVRARDVSHWFGHDEARKQVLFANTLQLMPGEIAVMTGPSGSGKTTLLTLIGALRAVQQGSLEVMGTELMGRTGHDLVTIRRRIGFIFQNHNLFDALTAVQNVRLALGFVSAPAPELDQRARAILSQLELGHRLDYKPQVLSGGQRQRIAIARALVARPRLILADEPTAALDKEAGRQVMQLLHQLVREQGSSVILVTHDSRVLESADRIINMVDGQIVSDVVVRKSLAICRYLATVDIFARLPPALLADIADRMSEGTYSAGDEILREGDPGDNFYVIGAGSVEVKVNAGGGARTVAVLGEGQVFGEAALLTDQPRNATIVARDAVQVYMLGKRDFKAAVAGSPPLKEQLLKVLFHRQ